MAGTGMAARILRCLAAALIALTATVLAPHLASAQTAWVDVSPPGHPAVNSVAVGSDADVWVTGCRPDPSQYAMSYPTSEHWDGQTWQSVTPAAPASGAACFGAVAEASAADVWAVGYQETGPRSPNPSDPQPQRLTLIEHWNGTAWSMVPSPNPTPNVNDLASIKVVSANDVWAVGVTGYSTSQQTVVEHWDGSAWSIVPSPNPGGNNSLYDLAVVSPTNIWAVGSFIPTGRGLQDWRSLVEHWDGSSWTVVTVPSTGNQDFLYGVSALGADDVWAVGATGTTSGSQSVPGLALHWDGTRWSIVPVPRLPTGQNPELFGVVVLGADDVWASGDDDQPNSYGMEMVHWDGTSWKQVGLIGPASTSVTVIDQLVALGPGDVWGAGTDVVHYTTAPGDQQVTLSLASSESPSVEGDAVTLTAAIAAPDSVTNPTGTVLFQDAGVTIASEPIVGGTATLVTSGLTPGTHTLAAVYPGAVGFSSASSPSINQTVVSTADMRLSFIHRAYQALLGRDVDAPSLTYWSNALSSGAATRWSMSMALATSVEYRADVIGGSATAHSFYTQYLLRPPDPSGVAYWTNQMASGATFEEVRLAFLASPEYFALHHDDPTETVTSLYHDVLGRAPDGSGLSYWVAHFDAATIASSILYSLEGREHLVNGYYQDILGRPADNSGLNFWAGRIMTGASDEDIIAFVLSSDEFYRAALLSLAH